METYIIKVTAATALFIAFYFLLLEKEKSLKFNRFYLLSSLMLSFVLPSIKIEVQPEIIIGQPELVELNSEVHSNINMLIESKTNWQTIFLVLYAAGVSFMLLKLIYGFVKMNSLKGETITYRGIKTKILEQVIPPFSFLNTLYIGKNYFIDGKMNEAIFLHEKNHIKSKHSLDLLFVEICKIVMWFNPAVYLYKKALVDNHEFSADETVVNTSKDIKKYQYLILSEIEFQQKFNFSNHFYFNNTKKRIIMMTTRKTSLTLWKNLLSLPLLAGVSIFAVEKVYGSNIPLNEKSPIKVEASSKKPIQSEIINAKPPAKTLEEKETPETLIGLKVDTIKPNKQRNIEKPASPPEPISPPQKEVNNETPATYPGGIDEFRKLFMNNFDHSKVGSEKGEKLLVKTEVTFNIDERGKISNIIASGKNESFNNETKRTVEQIASTGNWNPAQKGGKAVKSVYRFPITMNFE